ncbi:MAG: ABC transporter ATP-binding protein [Chlamydiales bacterium]
MAKMIHIENLWKSYDSLEVLKGLNLDVDKGETMVILGRSGVGKSVLLRLIIGLEQPDKGKVEFGEEIKAGRVGMLFQASALFDSLSIEDNTGFYLNHHPDPRTGKWLSTKEIRERVDWALECVDLAGVQKKMPADLSGGMRKRAALARVIAYKPAIVLYDEPTAGLDPITAMQINDVIKRAQKDIDATSIVVTHDLRSALEVGDRVALHSEGVIKHVAARDDFFAIEDPLIQQFFSKAKIYKTL